MQSLIQEVFTYEEIFGVLDKRSLMGGGHTWSCDCNNILQGTSTCTVALQVDDIIMLIMTFFIDQIIFYVTVLTPMNFSELLSVAGKGISRIAATAS